MKKTIYLMLISCLLFSFLVGAAYAAGGFDDMGENGWFSGEVKHAGTNEIPQGVTEALFESNAAIDRSTLVTALYKYSVMKGYDVSVGLDTNILKKAADLGLVGMLRRIRRIRHEHPILRRCLRH
ncbi:MAG: hypothetical protein M1587_02985 [Thaumarchaeota archaeon]|nr:hypothetical protein [Nitrososphaerota archaeon]